MKKSVALFLDYIVVILLGCITGIYIYIHFFDSISLVAGLSVNISKEVFIYGFFETLLISLLLAGTANAMYKVRHKGNPLWDALVFILLSIITWGIFFPGVLILRDTVYNKIEVINKLKEKKELSAGYIRHIDGKSYYFIGGSRNGSAKVMIINDENEEQLGNIEQFNTSPNANFIKDIEPFCDPLIKNTMNDMPFGIIEIFSSIKERASQAWNSGLTAWICFCTLGLALNSCYALIRISCWNLINMFLIIIMNIGILWFNSFYFSSYMEDFRDAAVSVLSGIKVLQHLFILKIDVPLVFINAAVGFLFIISGITIAALHKRKD